MRAARLLVGAALTVGLAAMPAAATAATVETAVVNGVLEIKNSGANVYLEDRGNGTWGVYAQLDQVTGCRMDCTGATSIRYVGEGTDGGTFYGSASTIPIIADGGPGNDRIIGGRAADVLRGGDGSDTLIESTTATPDAPITSDVIDGGPGDDTVDYSWANAGPRTAPVRVSLPAPGQTTTGNGEPGENDQITSIESAVGGAGDDVLIGNDGANSLTGNDGNDQLVGNAGTDRITGGSGDDSVDGGDGADTLQGEAGSNRISGGEDDDTIDSRNGVGETVQCGRGNDHVRSDLQLDAPVDCDTFEPQIVGELRFSGPQYFGLPVTATGITVLGDPAPTLTWEWQSCGRYSCGGSLSTTDTFIPTPELSRYPGYGFQVVATATNVYGTDTKSLRGLGAEQPLIAPSTNPPSAQPAAGASPSPRQLAKARLNAPVAALPVSAARHCWRFALWSCRGCRRRADRSPSPPSSAPPDRARRSSCRGCASGAKPRARS